MDDVYRLAWADIEGWTTNTKSPPRGATKAENLSGICSKQFGRMEEFPVWREAQISGPDRRFALLPTAFWSGPVIDEAPLGGTDF
jgi:hypothetical protein